VSLLGRHVAITGGAGFIGSHLAERVIEEDPASITVIDDFSTGQLSNLDGVSDRIRVVDGDICNRNVAAEVAGADITFHLAVRNVRASLGEPAENLRVNANGTLSILEAMRGGAGGQFVYVSSSEVYGIPESARFTESTVPHPTTVYGAGKLAGEHISLAYHTSYGMHTQVVRPFNNFGPRSHFEGDSGEAIPKFILRAQAGYPLHVHGDGTQTRDFMFVKDTADWLVRLASVDGLLGQVVNIGSGVDRSIRQLAETIVGLTGSNSPIEFGEPRPGDLPKLLADTAKISSIVDFELLTTFEQGLAETIAYFSAFDPAALLAQEVERNWT
jgi:UDP-glucose 4-epimerase